MRKKLISLLSLCALCAGATAQTVTVADVEALPGETVAFSVSLSEGKADKYTAMTLYVQFPETGFTTTGDYTVNNVWNGVMATVGNVDETGLATIPFASSNPIPGTAVDDLVTVYFKVDESVTVGTYDVTLKQTLFEYNTSDKDYADDVTFHVIVSDAVILDENSTTAPVAKENVNVRVKRTINANEWSTIVLPFAMTEAQVKAAFGEDVQIGDFKGYDTTEDGDGNIVAIEVKFDSNISAIEANHPYIIKVSSPITEFTVNDVDIDPEEEPCVEQDNGRTGRNRVLYSGFYGTYTAGLSLANLVTDGDYPLFLSGNKLWYAMSGTLSMKAFRGYFWLADVLTNVENASSRITLSFGGNATSISATLNDKGEMINEEIYDLQGRRVDSSTFNSQSSILRKGMYIRDGKVIVVK